MYKHEYELSIRRARDIAEEANRVKGEFLANMSHELKTPLNSVIGFTELARSISKEPEQGEYLDMALASAKSLLTLIESILDFARMEAGKLLAVSAPFSLDETLSECADSLAMRAFAKGLEVNLSRDPAIPDSLVGDQSLLKHILLNLLDNAVKFTEHGRIKIGAHLSEDDVCAGCGPTVEFEVADTGIGIAKDKIDFAFARFTQLDPSRTRRAGGTGLGLAIVSKSVELMGGILSVQSEEGLGSRFSVRITFDLGAEAGTEVTAPERVMEAIITGFDEESYSDAALVLRRLGIAARRAERLEDTIPPQGAIVVADERAALAADGRLLDSLGSRLVIGTRFGTKARLRIGDRNGIAFTALPLRAEGLRDAIASLALAAVPLPPSGPATPSGNQVIPRPMPVERGGAYRPGDDRGRTAGIVERRLLLNLAAGVEGAAAAGAFAEAEWLAKEAQGALSEVGDGAGSKLAFAALLLARKGDTIGLKDTALRMRATAGSQGEEK